MTDDGEGVEPRRGGGREIFLRKTAVSQGGPGGKGDNASATHGPGVACGLRKKKGRREIWKKRRGCVASISEKTTVSHCVVRNDKG